MTNLRQFLFKIYFKFASGSLIAVTLFTVLQTHYLVKNSFEKTQAKIEKLIQFHKNELLNEVALSDREALNQHLANMLREFDGESIELETSGFRVIASEEGASSVSAKRIFADLVSWFYPNKVLVVSLANDFGGFSTTLRVHFARSSVQKEVIPFLINSSIISTLLLLSIFIWSWINYEVLNRQVVVPLTKLVNSLQEQDLSLPDSMQNGELKIAEVNTLFEALKEYREYAILKQMADVYAQLSHDIRSPLIALTVADQDLKLLPEETRRLIRGAVARIGDIANQLLEKNRQSKTQFHDTPIAGTSFKTELIPALLEVIVGEKRLQYSSKLDVLIDFHLDASSYGLFAKIDSDNFKRVISNLVNNSVDALGDQGNVTVSMFLRNGSIVVSIKDTGCGIPEHQLLQIFEKGKSYNKNSGFGLGLYHARECARQWGGSLGLSSKEGLGTQVELTLPRSVEPSWFVPSLKTKNLDTIVVVDDDSNVHQVWKSRFATLTENQQIKTVHHFFDPVEFRDWLKEREMSLVGTLFLVDYEFIKSNENGLDVIESLGIQSQSILVTSRFEEKDVYSRSEILNLGLLPKACVGFIPIET